MLQFEASQLTALGSAEQAAYRQRLSAAIRQDFAEELADVGDADLQARVDEALLRFRQAGFHLRQHLHRLVVLELFFGPDFERALPKETQDLIHAPNDADRPPEGERFWAVYKAAGALENGPAPEPAAPAQWWEEDA